jgi:hypothetical protein
MVNGGTVCCHVAPAMRTELSTVWMRSGSVREFVS